MQMEDEDDHVGQGEGTLSKRIGNISIQSHVVLGVVEKKWLENFPQGDLWTRMTSEMMLREESAVLRMVVS